MAGFRDLLAQAKSQITEIDTNEADYNTHYSTLGMLSATELNHN